MLGKDGVGAGIGACIESVPHVHPTTASSLGHLKRVQRVLSKTRDVHNMFTGVGLIGIKKHQDEYLLTKIVGHNFLHLAKQRNLPL